MRKYKFAFTIAILISGFTGASLLLSSCNKDRDSITVEYIDKIKLGKLLFNDKTYPTQLGNPVQVVIARLPGLAILIGKPTLCNPLSQ